MPESALEQLLTVDAVEAQFGEKFVEPELLQVGVFIERVQDEMLENSPALNAYLAAGTVSPVRVRGVGVDAVIRAVENARIGHRVSSTEFPELTTRYTDQGEDSIGLTAAEIARLHPAGVTPTLDTSAATVVSLSG